MTAARELQIALRQLVHCGSQTRLLGQTVQSLPYDKGQHTDERMGLDTAAVLTRVLDAGRVKYSLSANVVAT